MKCETFIYFVRAENGLIKIGCTKYVDRRVVALQAFSPLRLSLLCYAPGFTKDEFFIHAFFRKEHSHSEWFFPSKALLSCVAEIQKTLTLPKHLKGRRYHGLEVRKMRVSHAAKVRARIQELQQASKA